MDPVPGGIQGQATSCKYPCSLQRVGPDDPWRSLPSQTILWIMLHIPFCVFPSFALFSPRKFNSDGGILKMMYLYGYHDSCSLDEERRQLMSLHSDRLQCEHRYICCLEPGWPYCPFFCWCDQDIWVLLGAWWWWACWRVLRGGELRYRSFLLNS